MGFIKEPKGVDFYVINRTLTDEEKQEISAFIKKDKENLQKRVIRQRKTQKI